jgi:hypothetical protein
MEHDDSYGTMGPEAFWEAYSSSCICKAVSAQIVGKASIEAPSAPALPPALALALPPPPAELDSPPQAAPLRSRSISSDAIRRHSIEPMRHIAAASPPPVPAPVVSRSPTKDIRAAERVETFPQCLTFVRGAGRLLDTITLNNTSSKHVAYRVRVSVPNLFVLQSSEGVLDPAQKLSIPVVLKAFPSGADGGGDSDASPLAKFAIEFLECEEEYYTLGGKAYWRGHADGAVKRTVLSRAVEAPPVSAPTTVSASTPTTATASAPAAVPSPSAAATRRASFAAATTTTTTAAGTGAAALGSNSFLRRRSSVGGADPGAGLRAKQAAAGAAVAAGPDAPSAAAVLASPKCLNFVGMCM